MNRVVGTLFVVASMSFQVHAKWCKTVTSTQGCSATYCEYNDGSFVFYYEGVNHTIMGSGSDKNGLLDALEADEDIQRDLEDCGWQ